MSTGPITAHYTNCDVTVSVDERGGSTVTFAPRSLDFLLRDAYAANERHAAFRHAIDTVRTHLHDDLMIGEADAHEVLAALDAAFTDHP